MSQLLPELHNTDWIFLVWIVVMHLPESIMVVCIVLYMATEIRFFKTAAYMTRSLDLSGEYGLLGFSRGPRAVLLIAKLLSRALGVVVDIAAYFMLRQVIIPAYGGIGTLLLLGLLINRPAKVVWVRSWMSLVRDETRREVRQQYFKSILHLFGALISSGFVLIVLLGFTAALSGVAQRRSALHADADLRAISSQLQHAQLRSVEAQKSLAALAANLTETEDSLTHMAQVLAGTSDVVSRLALERNDLQAEIDRLRRVDEAQIRNDAIYLALHDLLSSNELKGVVLSFVLGVLASIVANAMWAWRFSRAEPTHPPESGG